LELIYHLSLLFGCLSFFFGTKHLKQTFFVEEAFLWLLLSALPDKPNVFEGLKAVKLQCHYANSLVVP
jgi:hypothetical protein